MPTLRSSASPRARIASSSAPRALSTPARLLRAIPEFGSAEIHALSTASCIRMSPKRMAACSRIRWACSPALGGRGCASNDRNWRASSSEILCVAGASGGCAPAVRAKANASAVSGSFMRNSRGGCEVPIEICPARALLHAAADCQSTCLQIQPRGTAPASWTLLSAACSTQLLQSVTVTWTSLPLV